MATRTIDIGEIIDSQYWRGFLGRFLILLSLLAIFDGYNFGCMAFAAPSLIREWHIDKTTFGAVFAAVTLGGMIGAFAFGLVSDYWGRKPSVVTGLLIFGAMSLLTVRVANVHQLLALRFLTGIGVGALIPVLLTIAVEFAPRRLRAGVAMVAVIGIGLGITAAGFVGASLVPAYGWQAIFWIGGIAPLCMALIVFFGLPESPRFLLSRKRDMRRLGEILRRIDPSFDIPAGAEFTDKDKIVEVDAGTGRAPALLLFRGRLLAITMLLWVAFFMGTITPSVFVTWLPTLGEGLGVAPSFAALAVSIGGFGLIAASLLLMPLLQRFGFIVISLWTLIAPPMLIILGLTPVSNQEFVVLSVLLGFADGGSQGGTNAMVGQFYPDECRGTGVSWAVMMSRLGAVVGPVLTGVILSHGLSVRELFLLMAIPVIVFIACTFVLGLLHRRLRRDDTRQAFSMTTGEVPNAAKI